LCIAILVFESIVMRTPYILETQFVRLHPTCESLYIHVCVCTQAPVCVCLYACVSRITSVNQTIHTFYYNFVFCFHSADLKSSKVSLCLLVVMPFFGEWVEIIKIFTKIFYTRLLFKLVFFWALGEANTF